MTPAQFRLDFSEFSDIVRFPDSLITFWITVATAQVNPTLWGSLTNQGIELYVAHEVTISAQDIKAGSIGGVPGSTSGPAASKTVGSVAVSYDTTSTAEKDAGYWNLTTYGKQFIRLARIFGAGAIQL